MFFFHLSNHPSDTWKLPHPSSFAKYKALTLKMVPDKRLLWCRHVGRVASRLFSQKFCFSRLLNKCLFFSFNHPNNVCFGTSYFFDMDADDSPFSTSFSILYFSAIVLVLNFLLQPTTFDILVYKTKQQSFRRLYLFNFRTFEVSNHTNSKW